MGIQVENNYIKVEEPIMFKRNRNHYYNTYRVSPAKMSRTLLFVALATCTVAYPQKPHITPHPKLASLSFTPSQRLASVSATPTERLASVSETPSPRLASVGVNPNYKPNEYEMEQNRAARYQFSSDIEDNINDLSHRRDETREGLSVKGSYSYSDGYYQRTVFYEADEKGYRVTKNEVTPLQDGPQIDLTGTASVSSNAHGKHITYRVQSVPVPGPVPKVITEI